PHTSTTHFLTLFFCNATATTEIYTLSLHDALPIYRCRNLLWHRHLQDVWPEDADRDRQRDRHDHGHVGTGHGQSRERGNVHGGRSEEHTSELQSRGHLVCRLLLEQKSGDRISRQCG